MTNTNMTTININGQEIALTRKDFWKLYSELHRIAVKENIRGLLDCYRDDVDLTDEQYSQIVESIATDLEIEEDDGFDDYVLDAWGHAIEEMEE